MTNAERDELKEEVKILKLLLDFHIQNREHISLSKVEFEEYVDTILDRLNELKTILDEKQSEK